MLYNKFQGHLPLVSKEKSFEGFYRIWAWRPSCSCDLDHLNKILFPHSMEVPHEIWLQLARRFLKEVV